jgi:hypothetical protein
MGKIYTAEIGKNTSDIDQYSSTYLGSSGGVITYNVISSDKARKCCFGSYVRFIYTFAKIDKA